VTIKKPTAATVGIIGCGLVTQLQHLPNLSDRPDLFKVAAVCDVVRSRAQACAERFKIPKVFTDAQQLLDEELDGVIIATSGDHAELLQKAVGRATALLVEKPICFSSRDAIDIARAAEQAGQKAMVGYMRRHDASFRRLEQVIEQKGDLFAVRSRTLEAPAGSYLHPSCSKDAGENLGSGSWPPVPHEPLIANSFGLPLEQAKLFKDIVLESLVHEINMAQALAGAAQRVLSCSLSSSGVTCVLQCTRSIAQLTWVNAPGLARYAQQVEALGPWGIAEVEFPSPYLPSAGGTATLLSGGPSPADASKTTWGPAVLGPFQLELLAFHRLMGGAGPAEPPAHLPGWLEREPRRTSLWEGARDLLVCEAMARCVITGRPEEVQDLVPSQ